MSICTPQQLHAENVIAAARAGKHLVIEKPVCMTRAEGRAMREAIRAAGVKTVVSFVLRWNPLFQRIKRMSASGAFGEIFSVETAYHSYCGDWWGGYAQGRTLKYGGSAFLVAGCHAIDALRWFASTDEFGAADPVEVFAWPGGKRGRSTHQYNPVSNDWHEGDPLEYPGLEVALVKFANGVLGQVSVNFECIQPYAFPLRIFGDRGTVKDNRVWSHTFPGQRDWVELNELKPDSSDVNHHPFKAQMDHFVECLDTGRNSHCDFEDALKTHQTIFAAQRCYETRRPVRLDELDA